MINVSATITIDAPIETVWQVITDVNAYHEWNPLIPSAQGEARTGSSIDMLICPPGLMRRQALVKVLAVEPKREFRWLGRWGLPWILDGNHAFHLEALGPAQTQLTQKEKFSGILAIPFAPAVVPRMTQGFEAMNKALKARCEALGRQA